MSNKTIWIYKCGLVFSSNSQGKMEQDVTGIYMVRFYNQDRRLVEYTAQDLLRDENKIQELQNLGIDFQIEAVQDKKLVYINETYTPSDAQVINLGPLPFLYRQKVLASADKKAQQVIVAKAMSFQKLDSNLTEENFKRDMINFSVYLDDSTKNQIRYALASNTLRLIRPADLAFITRLSKSANDDKVVVKVQLDTKETTNENDTVYFRLSDYDTLRRVAEGDNLKVAYINPRTSFLACDTVLTGSVAWEHNLKTTNTNLPKEYVLGDDNNNDLEIRENEEAFYNAMVELIKEGIRREQNCKTDEEVQEKINQGIGSQVVNDYLLDNCKIALAFNWAHTGSISKDSYEDEDEDDDSDTSDRVEEVGLSYIGYYRIVKSTPQDVARYMPDLAFSTAKRVYEIKQRGNIKTDYSNYLQIPFSQADVESPLYSYRLKRDLVILFQTYLENTKNSFKYAEALIKLLRWGNVKPSMLKVTGCEENGVQKYLDMNEVSIKDAKIDFRDLTPDLASDGSDKFVTGLIYVNADLADKGYMASKGLQDKTFTNHLSAPVGVMYKQTFNNKEHQQTFLADIYAFMDIVKKEGGVLGVKYNDKDNTWSVTDKVDNDSLREVRLNSNLLNIRGNGYVIDANYPVIEDLADTESSMSFSENLNLLTIWHNCIHSTALADDLEKGNPIINGEYRQDWVAEKIRQGLVVQPREAYEWKVANDYFDKPFKAKAKLKEIVDTECDNYYLSEVLAAYTELGEVQSTQYNTSQANDLLERISQTTSIFDSTPQPTQPTTPPQVLALDKKIISYDITQPNDEYKYIVKVVDGKQKRLGFVHVDMTKKVRTFYAVDEVTVRMETFAKGKITAISLAAFEKLIKAYEEGTSSNTQVYTQDTIRKIREG